MEELSRVVLIHDGPAPAVDPGAKGYALQVVAGGIEALRMLAADTDIAAVLIAPQLPDAGSQKLMQAVARANPALPVAVLPQSPASMDAAALEAAITAAAPVSVTQTPALRPTAFCMLRLAKDGDMTLAFDTLNKAPGVSECMAVRGSYNLLLTVQADSAEALQQTIETNIRPLDSIADLDVVTVVAPPVEDALQPYMAPLASDKAGHLVQYLLIEVMQDARADVFAQLYFHPAVIACDATEGKFDMVIQVQGDSFNEIDAVVSRDIRPLDGIIRVRSLKAMRMYDM